MRALLPEVGWEQFSRKRCGLIRGEGQATAIRGGGGSGNVRERVHERKVARERCMEEVVRRVIAEGRRAAGGEG